MTGISTRWPQVQQESFTKLFTNSLHTTDLQEPLRTLAGSQRQEVALAAEEVWAVERRQAGIALQQKVGSQMEGLQNTSFKLQHGAQCSGQPTLHVQAYDRTPKLDP